MNEASNTQISNLLDSARAMKPRLKELAESVEQERKVSGETIEAFREAGFFKILQSEKYGGYELPPTVLNDIIFEVSSACGSSGWTLAVLALHQWEVRFLSDQAQDEIWSQDTSKLLSSSYVPSGSVEPVDGGYILNGSWPYSSGCDHAQWAIVGGVRPPAGPDQIPTLCAFFVENTDYKIIDDWNTLGLKGTGSKSLVLENVFVPSHRQHPIFGAAGPAPIEASPIFHIPFALVFVDMLAATCQGIAQGALEQYIERNLNRTAALDRAKYSESADVHRCIAETEFVIRSAVSLRQQNQAYALQAAVEGRQIETIEKARHLWESGKSVHACNEAIGKMYAMSGAHTIFEGDSLQRAVRDLQAGTTHVAFNASLHGRNYGAMNMGQPNNLGFI